MRVSSSALAGGSLFSCPVRTSLSSSADPIFASDQDDVIARHHLFEKRIARGASASELFSGVQRRVHPPIESSLSASEPAVQLFESDPVRARLSRRSARARCGSRSATMPLQSQRVCPLFSG